MKKALAVFLLTIIIAGSFSGCGEGSYKSGMTFTYLLPETVTSLDPQTAKTNSEKTVITAIFEGLCRLDETGQIVPGAAKKWESNENFTEFTFYLREGVCWSESTPLTAHDYLYGIQRALMPSTKATAIDDLFIIRNAVAVNSGERDISDLGVVVVDDTTIKFYLESGYEDFPKLTAGVRYMPCNQEFFESTGGKYGLDCLYTRTNGPFTFETNYSWYKDEQKYINLAKTYYYVGDHETVPSKVVFRMGTVAGVSEDPVSALYAGDIDLLKVTEEQTGPAKSKGCEVITLNDAVCGFLMNTSDEDLKNRQVREILTKTIDREMLTERLSESKEEATGIVPRCVKWKGNSYRSGGDIMFTLQDDSVISDIPYVLDELEAETMPSITIICPDDELSQDLANSLIVSWNSKLSNSYNMEPLPLEEFNARIISGNYQAAIYSMSANGTSPNKLFNNFSSSVVPQLLNDEEYDNMIKYSTFSLEGYRELERRIMEEYVFYPIYYDYSYYISTPFAKDIIVTPDSGVDFSRAYKQEIY